ncbi:MAG: response regulator transcription factor [Verrucomicrobia bacterium]|nr:response regulator transcription factor [Verrucomicrobiota bacterium]
MIRAGQRRNAKRFRVLIVDEHPLSREGLAFLINHQADMAVCAEAGSASQALEAVCEKRPDIMLLDIALPDKNGLGLIDEIKAILPELPIVVVSMHDESPYAEKALRAGAQGYVVKHEGGENLIRALRQTVAH